MTDKQEPVALKPCPFCGATGMAVTSGPCSWTDSGLAWNVTCHTRGCHGGIFALGVDMFATPAEAVAAWNTRPADGPQGNGPTLAPPVDGLAEVLAQIHELSGNKAAAFTLRSVGPVGEVLGKQVALLATALRAQSDAEVERIVAWLRGQAAIYNEQNPNLSALPEWTLAQKWANAIERGEHRKDGA